MSTIEQAVFFGEKKQVERVAALNPAFAAPYGEQPVSRIKPTPKVGDTLWIKHEVKRSSTGEVLGLMRNQKPVKSTIVAVFLDGSVRDNHSDCWEVKPSSLNNWETINPQREGKHQ